MNEPDGSHIDNTDIVENTDSEIDMVEFIRSEVPDFNIYEYSYEDGAYFLLGPPPVYVHPVRIPSGYHIP